jgi:peptidoglycan/LPS O-acetylase OafA/YrhL
LYLGLISYSLYLDHSLVIYSFGWLAHNKWVTGTIWIAASVLVASVTYRLIEKPAIDAGHRVGARWAARAPTKTNEPAAAAT